MKLEPLHARYLVSDLPRRALRRSPSATPTLAYFPCGDPAPLALRTHARPSHQDTRRRGHGVARGARHKRRMRFTRRRDGAENIPQCVAVSEEAAGARLTTRDVHVPRTNVYTQSGCVIHSHLRLSVCERRLRGGRRARVTARHDGREGGRGVALASSDITRINNVALASRARGRGVSRGRQGRSSTSTSSALPGAMRQPGGGLSPASAT
jgi:hypothetical protein